MKTHSHPQRMFSTENDSLYLREWKRKGKRHKENVEKGGNRWRPGKEKSVTSILEITGKACSLKRRSYPELRNQIIHVGSIWADVYSTISVGQIIKPFERNFKDTVATWLSLILPNLAYTEQISERFFCGRNKEFQKGNFYWGCEAGPMMKTAKLA